MADETTKAAGPGTLIPGDLVATTLHGVLRVASVLEVDASAPRGAPLSYVAKTLTPAAAEVVIREGDVEALYRPTWRRW
jgi:hypothetical protein